MARGRMIANQICRDKKIHELSDDTSRLAFTWLITFADVEGRTYGDPAIVRSMVFPRRSDISVERVDFYIQEWHDAGLIVRYEADGDLYIWFPAFEKNQPGMRKDREPESLIPPPPSDILQDVSRDQSSSNPDDCRITAGSMPDDIPVKLIKENGIKREENTTTIKTNGGSAVVVGGVFKLYESEIGKLSQFVSQKIGDWIDVYSEDWVREAIQISSLNNVRKMSYVEGILKRWKTDGKDAAKPGKDDGDYKKYAKYATDYTEAST